MAYRMISLDLDGTLTNDDKIITPRTLAALEQAAARGVHIVLASGRPTVGIRPLADQLDLAHKGGYILSYNGGRIVDCATGEALVNHPFPVEMKDAVCAFAHEQGVTALSYDERGIVTENPEDYYVKVEMRTNNIPANRVDDLAAFVNYPVNKFLLVGDPARMPAVEEAMQQRFAGRLSIYRSTPFFLEAMPLGVEKSASLAQLLDRLGLTREELMACGDGWNDMPMIRYAGLGVAMANAVPEVCSAADYITASNNEDGVGAAIEKFILKG